MININSIMKRLFAITVVAFVLASCGTNNSSKETVSMKEIDSTLAKLSAEFERISPRVIQPAEGFLQYPYLIPAGFYHQMWDWDGYFMSTWFIYKGKPEYMKYWALNFLEGVDDRGYVAGCMTTKGPRLVRGTFFMKPFLSQGVQRYIKATGDIDWVKDNYDKLCKVLQYRDSVQMDSESGLYFWEMAFQSGADNNPAMNYFDGDKRSFLAADCSTMQMFEYQAQAEIAEALGKTGDAETFKAKADAIGKAIVDKLWCPQDQCFYNIDRETGDFYKRVSYSSCWPLWANLLPQKDGKAMIERYLLDSKHMLSPMGLRSLSASDPDYNNKNIIVPFSNWQGPLWAPALVMYAGGMMNYGYKEELKPIVVKMAKLMLEDIAKYDTMHENYHAETGEGLAPDTSYKDANGNIVGFISWNLCVEYLLAELAR